LVRLTEEKTDSTSSSSDQVFQLLINQKSEEENSFLISKYLERPILKLFFLLLQLLCFSSFRPPRKEGEVVLVLLSEFYFCRFLYFKIKPYKQ